MLMGDGSSGERSLTFLGWAGAGRPATDARSAQQEIAVALECFAARFGQPATLVRLPLTSPITSYPGVQVDRVRTVPPGQVWPGAVLGSPAVGGAPLLGDLDPAGEDDGGDLRPSEEGR